MRERVRERDREREKRNKERERDRESELKKNEICEFGHVKVSMKSCKRPAGKIVATERSNA